MSGAPLVADFLAKWHNVVATRNPDALLAVVNAAVCGTGEVQTLRRKSWDM
jgi:hypothetical protein